MTFILSCLAGISKYKRRVSGSGQRTKSSRLCLLWVQAVQKVRRKKFGGKDH